ncbi:right-handed parallel beta-helix repeat-containing protein [Candidatus Acetothermia bacterium]|nr:right-handed parallel beta-helix repeat-containing protein [Candidatus Acetothermia bacterium]
MLCKSRIFFISLALCSLIWGGWPEDFHGQAKTISVCASGCAFVKIQAALNAANAGDTISVSTGVYKEFLRVKKSLTLLADGIVTLRVPSETSVPQPLITVDSAKEVRLKGFDIAGSTVAGLLLRGSTATIENNSFNDSSVGILITEASNVTLRQNRIGDGVIIRDKSVLTATQNTLRDGVGDGIIFINAMGTVRENEISKFEGNGITVKSNSLVTLGQNTIAANGVAGVEVDETSEATLDTNTINQNEVAGVSIAGRAKISNNQFNANEWGIRVGGNAEIRDNHIQASRWCALWADANAQVTGNVNKLSENGAELCGPMPTSLRQPTTAQTNKTQLNVPNDFKTLQEALDAVAPGGTVTVAAGTFTGPVGIYKSVTIQSANSTVLEGAKKIALVIASDAKKVSLQNLTLRGGIVGLRIEAGASEANVSLEQVTISSNDRDGVQVRSTALLTMRKSTFNANGAACVDVSTCAAISVGRKGLADGVASTNALAQVFSSTVSQNKGHGISLADPTLSTVEDSVFEQNQGNGIEMSEGAQAQVKNSSFAQNDNGLRAFGKAKLSMAGVKMSSQRFEGIRLDGREVQADILSVEIQQSRGNGILAQNGAQIAVRESKFLANSQYGLTLQDAGKSTLEKMTVSGNLAGGLLLSTQDSLTLLQSEIMNNKGTGIRVTGATKIEIRDSTISNNEGKQSDGISLLDSVQALLQGNRVLSNGRNGLLVADKISVELRSNQLNNNILWGVATYTKKCLPGDAQIPDQFNGRVTGAGNTVESNQGGDLCGVTGLR